MQLLVAFSAVLALVSVVAANPALEKRDSYNCFSAKVSGSDKATAVDALYDLLDDYPVVIAGGAIATQYGECATRSSISRPGLTVNIQATPLSTSATTRTTTSIRTFQT